jgi:acetolactate synthase-1/2/3 large subunit
MSSNPDLSTTLAEAMATAGTTTIFGMPGGGNNLDLIGAAEAAGIRFVLAHAETPAAIMAGVHADLTGTPTGCVVTRGPGAASAVNGVANADLDRQPMVMITDVVSAADAERIAHQRIDQRALYAPVTKWSATTGTGDVAGTVAHALAATMTQPRGPVHLDFDPKGESTPAPAADPRPEPSSADLERLRELVTAAERPVVVLGVGARDLTDQVRALLVGSPAPVLMTYRAKGLVPDSSPSAAGLFTGATTEAPMLEAADLIVFVGVDTVELIPNDWPYAAPVVALAEYPETSPYLTPEIEVVGDLAKLLAEVAQVWPATTWGADAGRQHLLAERARLLDVPTPVDGLAPTAVVQIARAAAPAGTIATVDAGAHMLPAMCLWDTEAVDEVLISSGLATMGFSVPAAVAAAVARPGRRVVAFVGDGGLGMSLGELETICRLRLPITVVVFNDSRLSLIAIKAKPEGNGGDNAIGYDETDFAAVATGYGLTGVRVGTDAELDAALHASFAHDGPTLLDVRVDPSAYPHLLRAVRGKRDAS